MNKQHVSLFTLAPLHIGCGSSVGIVDLPLLRERATGFPVLPGSSLKGVLSDLFNEDGEAKDRLFGKQEQRGKLLIGEGRLVAFPVRSAKEGFAWATCPLVLARLGLTCETLGEEAALGSESLALDNCFVLEEYRLERKGEVPQPVLDALQPLCDHPLWKETLKTRLVIISDTLFAYFAQNACEIAQHNSIDDETGIVKNGALFSQENVPSETLFVADIQALEPEHLETLRTRMEAEARLLQVGADATTGLGWCEVTFVEAK